MARGPGQWREADRPGRSGSWTATTQLLGTTFSLLINCHLCLAHRRGLRSVHTYSFVGHRASCTALLSCHACYRSTPAMIWLPTVSPPETAQRSGSYRGLPFRCAVLSSEWNKALWPAQVIYQLFFFPYPPYSPCFFSDPLLTSLCR